MSSSVHSARPLSISHSSLTSRGRREARWNAATSGERKEHVLQSPRALVGLCAKLIERPDAADPTLGEEHKPVADTLGITQLVDRKHEGAPPAGNLAQESHHLASLPQVKAIERLVHEKDGLWGEERESEHEPAPVTLRQRADPFAQNR